MYSYSFAPNPSWSRLFAKGDEIREYFVRVAREYDVVRHVRFKTELLDASWDDVTCRWVCETSQGALHARFLVVASGHLHKPTIPNVPGIDSFAGPSFHSSEWPEDFDPAGRRIAVVGTGASAIQFVPQIQPQAARLVVLQRTPPWIVPRPEVEHKPVATRRGLLRQRLLRTAIWVGSELLVTAMLSSKGLAVFEKSARRHLENQVRDPELRNALMPDYRFGCNRTLISSAYYPAVASDNVDYVASALAQVKPNSVVAADGREFEVDTVIWGTGFEFAEQPIRSIIRGRDGRTLTETWSGSPSAYMSATVNGFPNMFILQGPNSGTASQIEASEAVIGHLSAAVREMRRQSVEAVEVRRDSQEEWMRRTDAQVEKSVWVTGGCHSFYQSAGGRNVGPWPGQVFSMRRSLSRFDMNDYTRLAPERASAVAH